MFNDKAIIYLFPLQFWYRNKKIIIVYIVRYPRIPRIPFPFPVGRHKSYASNARILNFSRSRCCTIPWSLHLSFLRTYNSRAALHHFYCHKRLARRAKNLDISSFFLSRIWLTIWWRWWLFELQRRDSGNCIFQSLKLGCQEAETEMKNHNVYLQAWHPLALIALKKSI